ncbi:MAG: hypothetical protein MUO50_17325 [Longimicrobiales bacterium]|nr:hypothetical protein [Longimicrobiales bacterium]
MSRFFWVMTVLLVLLVAMGFAAANAGHRVTLNLGFFTLYQVPVTLVAFPASSWGCWSCSPRESTPI